MNNFKHSFPLINKELWNEIRGGAVKNSDTPNIEMFMLWDSQIETIDNITLHYVRKDYQMEGINIRWERNPFKIEKFANTNNKVYEY